MSADIFWEKYVDSLTHSQSAAFFKADVAPVFMQLLPFDDQTNIFCFNVNSWGSLYLFCDAQDHSLKAVLLRSEGLAGFPTQDMQKSTFTFQTNAYSITAALTGLTNSEATDFFNSKLYFPLLAQSRKDEKDDICVSADKGNYTFSACLKGEFLCYALLAQPKNLEKPVDVEALALILPDLNPAYSYDQYQMRFDRFSHSFYGKTLAEAEKNTFLQGSVHHDSYLFDDGWILYVYVDPDTHVVKTTETVCSISLLQDEEKILEQFHDSVMLGLNNLYASFSLLFAHERIDQMDLLLFDALTAFFDPSNLKAPARKESSWSEGGITLRIAIDMSDSGYLQIFTTFEM